MIIIVKLDWQNIFVLESLDFVIYLLDLRSQFENDLQVIFNNYSIEYFK